jgi:hypothetical protein
MIKEYITKPIKVEAIQFIDDRYEKHNHTIIKHLSSKRGVKENIDEVLRFTNSNNMCPKIGFENLNGDLCIRTFENNMVFVRPNDYIIKETYNNNSLEYIVFSVCSEKVFNLRYKEI